MRTCVVTVEHILFLISVPVHGRAKVWICVVTVQHILFILPVPVHGRVALPL